MGVTKKWLILFRIATVVWLAFILFVMLTQEKYPEDPPVVEGVAIEIVTVEAAEPEESEPDLASYNQIVNATVTAYCICEKCCGKTPDHPEYGITASGRPAEPYVSVAVDPFTIALGSTVYVDYGDGLLHEFRADDTGKGVVGAHIDVCYPDHQSALEHGVKEAHVYWKEES